MGANLAYSAYYNGQIFPGVKVATLELGGMNRNQAAQAMRRYLSSYRLKLQIDDKQYQIHPSEVGAEYRIDPTLDAAMAVGRNDLFPLLTLITKKTSLATLSFAYKLDKTKLTSYVERVITEQAEAPQNALVVINDGKPTVVPDKPGLGVEKATLVTLLQQSVDAQINLVQVRRAPVQAEVRVTAADLSAAEAARVIATSVTLSYNDKQFVPTPAEIASWIVFNKTDEGNLAVGFDVDKVKAYLGATIAAKIDIAAIDKKVDVVNGEVRSSEGGTDGLAVDRDALATQLTSNLLAKQGGTLAIPTAKVAFKTSYNRTYTLDDSKYVEINLSTQHLWAYQDHQVVFDSPVTSGATGYGFATVEGLFHVQAKQTDRYLDGRLSPYPYYVHVDYWMPFYGDYGMHDASWRGAFGGQDYYYQGSHGCVNLPLATAAWLYNFVSVGTPVWVHE